MLRKNRHFRARQVEVKKLYKGYEKILQKVGEFKASFSDCERATEQWAKGENSDEMMREERLRTIQVGSDRMNKFQRNCQVDSIYY